MKLPQKIDLHMHSTVSDGTDSPEELLDRVREAGLGLFALTDHDAAKGCSAICRALRAGDPEFICGVEFSCRDTEGKYHILGYGYDPDRRAVYRLIEKAHGLRIKKVKARIDFLRDEFGFVFPADEVEKLLSADNPGKPHIANLMIKFGYADTKETAIKEYINRRHFRSEYILPEDAIGAILESGGIPVLAHPSYGDGDDLILGEDMNERLRHLIGIGLRGVEAFYSGFTEKLRCEMLSFAERYDLYVTAGRDYHGKNKMIDLGDVGAQDGISGTEGFRRFYNDVRKVHG